MAVMMILRSKQLWKGTFIMSDMQKLDDAFLSYACNILADTDLGLSGMKIVEYCNAYAVDFNRITPHGSYPFDAPNKRTALKENLKAF